MLRQPNKDVNNPGMLLRIFLQTNGGTALCNFHANSDNGSQVDESQAADLLRISIFCDLICREEGIK